MNTENEGKVQLSAHKYMHKSQQSFPAALISVKGLLTQACLLLALPQTVPRVAPVAAVC